MRHELILQRTFKHNDLITKPKSTAKAEPSTLGEVKLIDTQENATIFKCFSLENGGEPTDESNKDKPIVAREYRLIWCFTSTSQGLHKGGEFRGVGLSQQEAEAKIFQKYKNLVDSKLHPRFNWGFWNLGLTLWTPELKSFVDRSVFIHNGNYPQDTQACLLFGYSQDKTKGIIGNSSQCIEDFNKLVLKIGAENIKLTIKDIQ